jgi:hypothetical protein
MKTERCPECKKVVDVLPDGSLAMHAQTSGALCSGTNCVQFVHPAITIGNLKIECREAWLDPDQEEIEDCSGPAPTALPE